MAGSWEKRASLGVRAGALYLAVVAIVVVVLGPLVWAVISSISPFCMRSKSDLSFS